MNTDVIGRIGERYVMQSMQRIYANPKKVPNDIDQQMKWGDLVQSGCKFIGAKPIRWEVKTELDDPNGNFFIERWSNRKTGRDGWLKTSPADELFYLYLNKRYGFRFPNWQQTAFIIEYQSNAYKLVEQKKNIQSNDTWGYLVPQSSLEGPFAPIKFELSEKQLKEAGFPSSV